MGRLYKSPDYAFKRLTQTEAKTTRLFNQFLVYVENEIVFVAQFAFVSERGPGRSSV
jgi:hypothetical protein